MKVVIGVTDRVSLESYLLTPYLLIEISRLGEEHL